MAGLVEDELCCDGVSVGGLVALRTAPPETADGRVVVPATAILAAPAPVGVGGVYQIRRPRLGEQLSIQVDAVEHDHGAGRTTIRGRIFARGPLDPEGGPGRS